MQATMSIVAIAAAVAGCTAPQTQEPPPTFEVPLADRTSQPAPPYAPKTPADVPTRIETSDDEPNSPATEGDLADCATGVCLVTVHEGDMIGPIRSDRTTLTISAIDVHKVRVLFTYLPNGSQSYVDLDLQRYHHDPGNLYDIEVRELNETSALIEIRRPEGS